MPWAPPFFTLKCVQAMRALSLLNPQDQWMLPFLLCGMWFSERGHPVWLLPEWLIPWLPPYSTLEKFLDKRLWYFEAVIRVNIKPIAPDVQRRYHILIIGDHWRCWCPMQGLPQACTVRPGMHACMHHGLRYPDSLTVCWRHYPAPPPLWLDFQNQLDLVLTCFRDRFWLHTTTF